MVRPAADGRSALHIPRWPAVRRPPNAAISCIEIVRTREEVKVILKTARPGLVIGPKGAEVEKLKNALEDLTDRRVSISITEIRNPDLDAQLVAEGLAEQLKRRASFRRTLKMRAEATMQAGAKGAKIIISGRLGGAEIARSETQSIVGRRIRRRIFKSRSMPLAIRVLKTSRVTNRAVNMLVTMPIPSTVANPLTSSVLTSPRITQVISVVRLASTMVESALS